MQFTSWKALRTCRGTFLNCHGLLLHPYPKEKPTASTGEHIPWILRQRVVLDVASCPRYGSGAPSSVEQVLNCLVGRFHHPPRHTQGGRGGLRSFHTASTRQGVPNNDNFTKSRKNRTQRDSDNTTEIPCNITTVHIRGTRSADISRLVEGPSPPGVHYATSQRRHVQSLQAHISQGTTRLNSTTGTRHPACEPCTCWPPS